MKNKTVPVHVANIISERERLKKQLRKAGPHLADLRFMEGLSQVSMAAALGISQSMLNYIEHGERALSLATAHAACNIFNVSLDKLIAGWSQSELNAAMNRRQTRLVASQMRLEHPDRPQNVPDDLLETWYFEVRRGQTTEEQLAERWRKWMPEGIIKTPEGDALLFKLDNKALVTLANKWAQVLDISPSQFLEALLIDFLADATVWNATFQQPFPVPAIRRDIRTNELLLGEKLLESLIESKTKFIQDGLTHTRNRLEVSLRDELVVDKLIEETRGEAAVQRTDRKKK